MDAIFQRQVARLNYVDPEELLREIMPTVMAILRHPETVTHLSDREKGAFLQKHQAGFLALLTKRHAEGQSVEVKLAYQEIADFDCVLRSSGAGKAHLLQAGSTEAASQPRNEFGSYSPGPD